MDLAADLIFKFQTSRQIDMLPQDAVPPPRKMTGKTRKCVGKNHSFCAGASEYTDGDRLL